MLNINKNNFDFLRMLMAVIVFCGHFGALSGVEELKILQKSPIEFAVFAFFVISGFLIARSYERTTSLKNYFKKRINRIFPGYILVVLLCAFGLSIISTFPMKEYFANPQVYKYLFWNLIFMNFKAPNLPGVFGGGAVNGALWTIKIELGFYVLLPLMFIFLKNKKKVFWGLLVFYLLSIIYHNYFMFIGKAAISRQIFGALCYFVAGMAVYFYFEKFVKYKLYLFIGALLLVWVDPYFDVLLLSPLIIGIAILFFAYSFPIFNNFGKYGDFTYGIYIFHFPLIRMLKQLNFYEVCNPYLGFILTFMLVVLIGYISWHYYEKKFMKA